MIRSLIRIAALFYPVEWRRRYGDELLCLTEDANAGWKDMVDLIRGGLAMRLSSSNVFLMAIAWGTLGVLLTGLVALRVPDLYRADLVMSDPKLGDLNSLRARAFTDQKLRKLVTVYDLYKTRYVWYSLTTATEPTMDERVAQLRQDLRVETVSAGSIQIGYNSRHPALVAQVTNQAASMLVEESVREKTAVRIAILTPARMPEKPFWPNRSVIVGSGFCFGALLGALLALSRRHPVQFAS